MLKRTHKVAVFLCFFCTQIDAARILAIFPTPSISHQVVFRPLTIELVKRGHEVVVITTDPAFPSGQAPANLTEIDVHDISYKHWHDVLLAHKGNKTPLLTQLQTFLLRHSTVLDLQLRTPEVQELLKRPKDYFDLLILEACSGSAVGISNIFNAPIVQISSFGLVPRQYNVFGAPIHPLLFPTPERQRIYNLTRWEKIVELFKYALAEYLLDISKEQSNELFRHHFNGDLSLENFKNIKMIFVNEHPIWADNRPTPPSIQYIGGIHQSPDTELPKDLKSYLDASKNGVIYMSLGTNVVTSILPPDIFKIMIRVFSTLPYDVLMKWDDHELPEIPPNVKIQKWFPQPDILKHPKVKLFITQAGLQSTDEAINAAVPLLAIPMLGDQWYNAEKYVRHKIGLQLDFQTINEADFKRSIETIINDKSYKENMLRLRALMREYPIKPLDLAVWWTEHIIKYGGDHLVPPNAYMSWAKYYEIELVLICLCAVSFFICLSIYMIKALCKIIWKKFLTNSKLKTK